MTRAGEARASLHATLCATLQPMSRVRRGCARARRLTAALLGAVVALLGAGCVDAERRTEEGATLYTTYCASCHGLGATGDGPLAESLTPPPADLTAIALRNDGRFEESEILATIDGRYEVVAHGPRDMPVWGAVFRDQHRDDPLPIQRGMTDARALVDYLRTLQRDEGPGSAPAEELEGG